MKNSPNKANIPSTKPNASETFGGSKGISSPKRKHFGNPGASTKDMKHGVNEKKHNLKAK